MTTNNTLYRELARLEEERDRALEELAHKQDTINGLEMEKADIGRALGIIHPELVSIHLILARARSLVELERRALMLLDKAA